LRVSSIELFVFLHVHASFGGCLQPRPPGLRKRRMPPLPVEQDRSGLLETDPCPSGPHQVFRMGRLSPMQGQVPLTAAARSRLLFKIHEPKTPAILAARSRVGQGDCVQKPSCEAKQGRRTGTGEARTVRASLSCRRRSRPEADVWGGMEAGGPCMPCLGRSVASAPSPSPVRPAGRGASAGEGSLAACGTHMRLAQAPVASSRLPQALRHLQRGPGRCRSPGTPTARDKAGFSL